MEDSSNSSPDIMSALPHLKEIGVGTTESLPKDKKKSKKDKKEKEAKRDKERAQAEAIEREIITKKSLERPKSKAPKPPKTYFTDNAPKNAKIEVPTVNTEERKKKLFESLEKKESVEEKPKKKDESKKTVIEEKESKPVKEKPSRKESSESKTSKKQVEIVTTKDPIKAVTTFKEPINDQGTLDKKPSQKDRSVDVYHETVRQRATRNSEAIKEVFADVQEDNIPATANTVKKPNRKKNRAPQNPQKDINDEDLPSVKELRSRFEKERSNSLIESKKIKEGIQESSAPKKSWTKPSKIDFKKGFNVMSSLTRRSAMSVSKSMQNLNLDNQHQQNHHQLTNSNSKKDDMEFSHFTYSETEALNSKNNAIETKQNGKNSFSPSPKNDAKYIFEEKDETPISSNNDDLDPVYVNIESTKKQKQPEKEQTKSSSPPPPIQVQHRARNGGESSAANKLLQSLDNDEEEDNQTGLGPWNPTKIVAHLYKLADIKPLSKGDGSSKQGEELEGYIERLPPGKKKSTIWNSWKRQYFVAKAGLLLIFGDSSRSVLMDRIELFGGRVDYMESTMLGIQDRRGHYVVLRFKDNEDADKWHTGLSNHVSHDLAQTFVTPVANSNPDLFKQILIIDFGGSSIRAGIACSMPTLPQLFFPSVMAIGKGHEDEKYFGMDAFAPEIRSRCNLVHPFAPSSNVDKYTVNQVRNHVLIQQRTANHFEYHSSIDMYSSFLDRLARLLGKDFP